MTQWNIFDNGDDDLVIVSLKGSDGKEDHCVTLYGKWIFDSNFSHALPLCQESLDYCCSTENNHETFVSVVAARMFTQYHHMLKK